MPKHVNVTMSPDQQQEFNAAILKQLPIDIDPDVAQGWITNPNALRTLLRDALTPRLPSLISQIAFKVATDYSKSLAEMIKAGKYDGYVDPQIEKLFVVKGNGLVEGKLVLLHFNRPIEHDEAIKLMEAEGFEPAQIGDLLAFGEKNPELQCQFPIIALGSVAVDSDRNRVVPCLDSDNGERDLALDGIDDQCDAICRFLARRKV